MLFNTKDSGTILGSFIQSRQTKQKVGEYQDIINNLRMTKDPGASFFATDFKSLNNYSDDVKGTLDDIKQKALETGKTGEEAISDIEIAMRNTAGEGTKLGNSMKNIGLSILNGLASAAISIAISALISLIGKVADKLIITRKEAEALSKQFDDTFSTTASDYAKTAAEISKVQTEYELLSKGVNELGENVSLTEEEFERYHEITDMIAEKMPELIQGYDNQGEAIIRLKDNVNSLTEAYKENQEAAALDLYKQTDENGNIINGVFKKAQNDIALDVYEETSASDSGRTYTHTANIQQQLEMRKRLAQASQKQLQEIYRDSAYGRQLLQDMIHEGYSIDTDDEAEFKRLHVQLEKNVKELETTLEDDARRVAQAGLTYAQAYQGFYTELTSDQQKYVNAVMNSLDFEFVMENGLFNQEEMEKYVQSVMDMFKNGDISDEDMNQIKLKLNLATELNGGEISLAEYYQQLQQLNKYYNSLPEGDIKKVISILFNLSVGDEEKIDDKVSYFKKLLGDNWDDKYLEEITSKELDLIMKIKPQFEYDEKGNLLYDAIMGYDDRGNKVVVGYEPRISPYEMEDVKKQIEDGINPIEVEIKPNVSDEVERLNNLDTAIGDALSNTYSKTITEGGKADVSDIAGVNSAFGGVTFDTKEGEEINALSNAIEGFNQELVENAGDAEKSAEAHNKLITAYIDQENVLKELTDNLDDVTESEKAYYVEQLKNQGITNASEVVESRLSKGYKEHAKALKELSKYVAQYSKDIKTAIASENKNSSALTNMTSYVQDMLTVYDDEGNAVYTPEIDSSFIIKNSQEIYDAIEGDINAVKELRLASLDTIQLSIDLNDSQVYEAHNQLINLISELDASDFTIDGFMNNSAAYAEMNSLINQAGYTGAEVQKIIAAASGGTITAKVEYEEITTDVPSATLPKEAYKGAGTKITYTPTKVKVPKFTFKYKENGDLGSMANYGGGGSSGSGGGDGSGGGGGGSDKDTAKDEAQKTAAETFDWIEVYIKRLEEAIARLDKDATNVYKNWSDRNKSLTDEIAKITEQIKAQDVATSEYNRNAELVSATGKVMSEKQNTKMQKAKEAWTQKLQDAIIGGKYTTKKGKLNKKKLKKDLGDSYNGYLEAAAEELFSIVKYNKKVDKKNAKITDKKKKKKKKSTKNVVVGNNKPKKSDYGDDTEQYKADLKEWKEAQKLWSTGEYQKKIREGTMTGKDIESIDNKYLIEAIKTETDIVQKAIDSEDTKQQKLIDLADKYREGLDNAITKWDQIVEINDKQISILDKYISRVETAGYWVNEKFYEEQLEYANQTVKDLEAKQKEAQEIYTKWNKESEDLGGFGKQSEAARKAQLDLLNINEELAEAKNHVEEIKKALREIPWEQFDWVIDKLGNIRSEAEALSEVLTLNKTMDDNGFFNNRGMANLAMLGTEYENSVYKLQKYAEMRKKLNDQLVKEPLLAYNKDFKEEMDKVNEGYYDAYKDLGSNLNNISSVFKESIDQNLANLKKMMDEYKNALTASKDLYDWQKNISNQTGNIDKLRKQLTAYQGDTTEAGRKRRQELTNQLTAAEQQLQETEWDRYINQTGEMLDNLYTDYEENLNSRLENITGLMDLLVYEINNNGNMVADGLTEIMRELGIDTDHFKSLTEKDNKKILSEIQNGKLVEDSSKILKEHEAENKKLDDQLNAMENPSIQAQLFEGDHKIKFGKNGGILVENVFDNEENGQNTTDPLAQELAKNNISLSAYEEAQKKVAEERGTDLIHVNTIDSNAISDKSIIPNGIFVDPEEVKEVARIQSRINAIKGQLVTLKPLSDKNPSLKSQVQSLESELRMLEHKLSSGGSNYATGTRGVSASQLAWTQEKGSELIFRRSDGAMLTPLGSGDMVFTHSMSQRLWELAQELDHAKLTYMSANLPDIKSNLNTTINQNNQIEITLPNVNDYASFKYELQNDLKFEKFIQEITLGQAMGNNTLNKRKY